MNCATLGCLQIIRGYHFELWEARGKVIRRGSGAVLGRRQRRVLEAWADGRETVTHVTWYWHWLVEEGADEVHDMVTIRRLLGDVTPVLTRGLLWLFLYARATRRIGGKTCRLASPTFARQDRAPDRVVEAIAVCTGWLRRGEPGGAGWVVERW